MTLTQYTNTDHFTAAVETASRALFEAGGVIESITVPVGLLEDFRRESEAPWYCGSFNRDNDVIVTAFQNVPLKASP